MSDVGENGAIVEYGINGLILKATGTTEKFVDGGPAKHTLYIHRVSDSSTNKKISMETTSRVEIFVAFFASF